MLGAIAAGGFAACGGGGGASIPSAASKHAAAGAQPAAVIPQARSALPGGTRALRHALGADFTHAGPSSGASVYDLTDHESLFTLRANIERPPASVEKIFTTIAVLKELGPNTTLQTSILGAGQLGAGGIWHGDLYLRGGGDPTFGDGTFNRIWEDGQGPTAAELIRQLQGHGIRRITGRVIGDGSLFDPRTGPPSTRFQPDIPDLGGQLSALTYDHGATGKLTPPTFAAKQLATTMRSMGIQARAAKAAGTTPLNVQPLASVSSPPMSVLLRLMDVPSDDLFAELLAKQLGVRFGGGGSTAAGAQVISSAISSFGVNPRVVDGSGLSRSDHASPRQVVNLLRSVYGTSIGGELEAALPTVGVNGTVRTIAVHTAAQGHCVAKTGTLNNVTNLAGYCHAAGHKRIAFALFIDGPGNWTALQLMNHMVAAIARL